MHLRMRRSVTNSEVRVAQVEGRGNSWERAQDFPPDGVEEALVPRGSRQVVGTTDRTTNAIQVRLSDLRATAVVSSRPSVLRRGRRTNTVRMGVFPDAGVSFS